MATPRRLLFLVSLLLILLVPVGATSAHDHNPSKKLKIGVMLPLSGELAEYGVAAKNGIVLAQAEHPELFNNIDFLFEDSRYDNALSISTYNQLRQRGDISLIYLWGYGPSQAVIPIAEAQGFPVFACSSEQALAKGRKYIVVGLAYYTRNAATALLEHLRSKGFKRFGVLKTEIAFMNSIYDEMKNQLKEGETLEQIDSFSFNDMDFKASISKLRSKNFDAIGVFLIGGQVSQFYKQLAQLHMKVNTFGTDFFDSLTVVQQANGTMEDAVFQAPYFEPGFANRYIAKFGNDAQASWAAHSYEFALLTARLFGSKGGNLTPEQISEAYRNAGKQKGVTGEYEYKVTSDGAGFNFGVTIKKIENNLIVDVPR